jgi:hypothetical protein
LRRIYVLLSVVLAVVSPSAAAQVPALEALKASGAGFVLQAPPAVEPLLLSPRACAPSLSGEALFSYLHDATVPAPRKAAPSYKASKAFMYSSADNTGCNGTAGIITFYSQVCAPGASDNGDNYKEQGDQNRDGVVDAFINAEHLWPQSYFKSALPMVADLHHLRPTFVTPNGRRGNLKFGLVPNYVYSTASGSKLGKSSFEPADAVKGDVARAMFYFIVRYSDRNIRQGMDYAAFWTANVPMLLQWNRMDPPDAAELRRNGLVEDFQGNRNPFVDDPSLADRIGEMVFKAH